MKESEVFRLKKNENPLEQVDVSSVDPVDGAEIQGWLSLEAHVTST